jgi:tape measure domain-containing protein
MALEAGSVVAKFKADISEMKSGISQVKSQVSGMKSSFANAGKEMASAGQAIATGLGIVAVAMAAVGYKAIKVTGDLESQRMAFKTLLGSVEEADAALEMIKKDAASTPFEMMGLINANKLLTAVTGNAQDSERMLLNVGKAIAATGGGQEALDRIIVNLQQIGSVGKASMIDIKQFAFAGIPIFKMLEEATGKSGEALGDMISNGEVN